MENTEHPNADSHQHQDLEEASANAGVSTDGKEVLVVASKLKNYIRAQSGMNTSSAVMEVLSERIRALCDQAVANARSAGRKTVMDRDFS